jgi:excisionase family DNA binding protein
MIRQQSQPGRIVKSTGEQAMTERTKSATRLTPQMREQLEQTLERLRECVRQGEPIKLAFNGTAVTEAALPAATVEVLQQALTLERQGKRFMLVAEDEEVSPERAAELLHISRPTLLKKLDGGELPFHYVGTHRRITMADLMEYKRQRQEQGKVALQTMVELAEDMGLYDSE